MSYFICLKCAEKITWEHECLSVGCLGKRYCKACGVQVDIEKEKKQNKSPYEAIREKDSEKLLDILADEDIECRTEYCNGCYLEYKLLGCVPQTKFCHKRRRLKSDNEKPGIKEWMHERSGYLKRKEMLDNLHKELNLKEGEVLIVKEILALPEVLLSLKKKIKHE